MPGQTSIVASAIIPASPERVWEIACDTSRYPEWVENTLRMIRTDGPARAGATMEELTRIAGPWKSVTRWRVTEFDPPRRQVQEGRGLVLLAGRRAVRRRGGQRREPAGHPARRRAAVRNAMSTARVGQLADCRSLPWPCPPARPAGYVACRAVFPDHAGASDLGLGRAGGGGRRTILWPGRARRVPGAARAVRAGGLARSRERAGAGSV
jgi:Polyketide cyclase / dehydrase and lipid transport